MPQNVPRKLIFVASALRSGSTLLRLMLDSHPKIKSPGEFDFLLDPFGVDVNQDDVCAFDCDRFRKHLQQNRIFRAQRLSLPSEGNCVDSVREIVREAMAGAEILAVNVHRNFFTARQVFPHALFIHLVRDPRDCAISSVNMGWAGNVYYGVEPWIEAEQSWDRLSPQLSETDFVETSFENLVRDPVMALNRICDFVRLTYDSRMMEFSHSNYKRPDPRYACQWQETLAQEQIRIIKGRVATLMQRRGYDTSGLPPLRLNVLSKAALTFQNEISRNTFAIRRYGFPLWAGEKIARWLRLSSSWSCYRKKIDEIDTMHLK